MFSVWTSPSQSLLENKRAALLPSRAGAYDNHPGGGGSSTRHGKLRTRKSATKACTRTFRWVARLGGVVEGEGGGWGVREWNAIMIETMEASAIELRGIVSFGCPHGRFDVSLCCIRFQSQRRHDEGRGERLSLELCEATASASKRRRGVPTCVSLCQRYHGSCNPSTSEVGGAMAPTIMSVVKIKPLRRYCRFMS